MEMSDAVALGSRELELHQDEKIYELVVQLYTLMLKAAGEISKRASSRQLSLQLPKSGFYDWFNEQIKEMRQVSDKIMREVDYRHRLEMREATRKIAEIHVEQHKIVAMLQDQRRILESMQQERKIMDAIHQQQQILQVVQQIQQDVQSRLTDRSS